MRCPKCKYDALVKNGIVRENQRYRCKRCFYNFVQIHEKRLPHHIKLLAVITCRQRYKSAESISKLLGVSRQTVSRWLIEATEHHIWFISAILEYNFVISGGNVYNERSKMKINAGMLQLYAAALGLTIDKIYKNIDRINGLFDSISKWEQMSLFHDFENIVEMRSKYFVNIEDAWLAYKTRVGKK